MDFGKSQPVKYFPLTSMVSAKAVMEINKRTILKTCFIRKNLSVKKSDWCNLGINEKRGSMANTVPEYKKIKLVENLPTFSILGH